MPPDRRLSSKRLGRRTGIASLLMIPALAISFTVAGLAGTGLQAALGLRAHKSIIDLGTLGVLAALLLTLILVAPQAVGIALGLKARRLGHRLLGTCGIAVNAAIIAFVVLILALNLALD